MAASVTEFAATIPAGTAQAAPLSIPLATGTVNYTRIRWRVPAGPRGHLGWCLTQSGVQVLPAGGQMMIADGEWDFWDLGDFPQSGAWAVLGYNTGTYPHTIYLTFSTGTTSTAVPPPPDTGNLMAGFPLTDWQLNVAWQ